MAMTSFPPTTKGPIMANEIKYIDFSSVAQLNKYIDNTNLRGSSLQARYQVAAMGAVLHTAKHGTHPTITRILDGMSEGLRKSYMINWFKLSGITFDDSNKKVINFSKDQYHAGLSANKCELKQALHQKMWWTCKPPAQEEAYNLYTALTAFMKKATKAEDKRNTATIEGDIDTAEQFIIPDGIMQQLKVLAIQAEKVEEERLKLEAYAKNMSREDAEAKAQQELADKAKQALAKPVVAKRKPKVVAKPIVPAQKAA